MQAVPRGTHIEKRGKIMGSYLSRFEPMAVMEDFFRDFHLRPSMREWNVEPRIKMDVSESDDAYSVKAEIPGVKKEDISVDVDGNVVSISAELKRESEQKSGKSLRTERYYGAQSRSFSLAHDIDSAKVDAKYADGILSLTLPKLAGKASKQVTVK
jgi:HSP20 family protein